MSWGHPRWRRGALGAISRSPAVHFAVVGALLYGLSGSPGPQPEDRAVLEISAQRVALLRTDLHLELGRAPSPAELQAAVDTWIDGEVLIRHAVELGLDREPAVERRLAQIAAFVDGEARDPQASEAVLADRARELGLHMSDRVVRNILIDRASRLIRAAVLVREPTEGALRQYLEQHADLFRTPSRLALAHVELRRASMGEAAEKAEAQALLERLAEALPEKEIHADALAGWGDAPSVPSVLPALTERDLIRRFGPQFVDALAEMPEGEWSGPVRSAHGLHLVKVQERRPGALPPLSTVEDQVRGRLRHELAERWLQERLQGLRAEFDVRLSPDAVAMHTLLGSEVSGSEVSS